MKRKTVMMSTVVFCMVLLVGCGEDGASSNGERTIAEENAWMETRIAELKEENAALLEEIQALDPEFVLNEEEETTDSEGNKDEETENDEEN